MTTLENSYCVPRTVKEWVECVPWLNDDPLAKPPNDISKCSFVAFADGTISKEPREGMTELPVHRFLDLLHDRIVPWRLEERGFNNPFDDTYTLRLEHDWDGIIVTRVIRVIGGKVSVNGDDVNVTTFTDLLTLIRMLTPPSNA